MIEWASLIQIPPVRGSLSFLVLIAFLF
jgi:hypothetical protein